LTTFEETWNQIQLRKAFSRKEQGNELLDGIQKYNNLSESDKQEYSRKNKEILSTAQLTKYSSGKLDFDPTSLKKFSELDQSYGLGIKPSFGKRGTFIKSYGPPDTYGNFPKLEKTQPRSDQELGQAILDEHIRIMNLPIDGYYRGKYHKGRDD
jgi:hypothetical protein